MEASPGSDNFCSTFFSSSPISHGEDGLSTICLLFIVYLPDIYEFTFYTFYCSNMLLSIAYFAWGRVIIYDDNLSCRSLSQAKRKIYIFLLSLFERKTRKDRCHVFCERFKTCLLNENHTEQFALRLHEASWVIRITGECVIWTVQVHHQYVM
jgi:hypothetical protein